MSKKQEQGVVEQEVLQPAVETVDATVQVDDDSIDAIEDSIDDEDDPFAEYEDEADDVKSKKDIIKELLASKRCKAYRNLSIRNIEHRIGNNNTYFMFVINDAKIIGNAVVNNTNVIQKTNSFVIGSFAVRSTMFDNPKMSIFANDVLTDDKLAGDLFNGGKVDIIAQLVKSGEEYINPFSSNDESHIFTEDRIVHYITSLEFGPSGDDIYKESICRNRR